MTTPPECASTGCTKPADITITTDYRDIGADGPPMRLTLTVCDGHAVAILHPGTVAMVTVLPTGRTSPAMAATPRPVPEKTWGPDEPRSSVDHPVRSPDMPGDRQG